MNGEGMIAAARDAMGAADDWTPSPAAPAPERNPFYANAAKRLERVLPELPLSPELLAVIDLALHEERQAARRGYEIRDGARG